MKNILIIYAYRDFPMRVAIKDHLYSFKKHSKSRCFYLNIQGRSYPKWLTKIKFDLVIFHTIFLSTRWDRQQFRELMKKAEKIKNSSSLKVALPQDEFINTDLVCDFIREFKVDIVLSVSPSSEWNKIYKDLTESSDVKFYEVLTGYIKEERIGKTSCMKRRIPKDIDIGYRAWKASYWLGKHGQLKSLIAEQFSGKALSKGLKIDISTRDEDTIKGEEWFDFLSRCKYTIGVEGGSSILDENGSIREKTEMYLNKHPGASFKEVEKMCFPEIDGNLKLFALSPRHFEACLTKTCQILVEGYYNDVFLPWIHYIPVDKEFKHVDEVLDIVRKDELREEITENAFRDIVMSGKYSYKRFVEMILGLIKTDYSRPQKFSFMILLLYYLNEMNENLVWIRIYFYIEIKSRILNFIPEKASRLIRKMMKRSCAA